MSDNITVLSLVKKEGFASQIEALDKLYKELNKALIEEREAVINFFSDEAISELIYQIEVKMVIDEEDGSEVILVSDEDNNYLFNDDNQLDIFIAKKVIADVF